MSLVTKHSDPRIQCSLRDDKSVTSRTSQRRQSQSRGFGSAVVRCSVAITPPASSTYQHPVRNGPPPGSGWARFRSPVGRATGKAFGILKLSDA